ncbi:MAG: hypothetical protein WCH84_02210 [Verrucomicrobiota bacterium]
MRHLLSILTVVALSAGTSIAGDLPTFADFRRMDQTRRLTGQLQTAELLKITQLNPVLIADVVQRGTNDAQLAWGAAELLTDWPARRTLFETVLATVSNRAPVALRYACAAARQGEYDTALKLARFCQMQDSDNTVPWLLELWILSQRKLGEHLEQSPPLWTTNYRDYTVEACEARIRVLELAGYSAYSARRLGFKPDSDALFIAQNICKPPFDEVTKRLLRSSGESLQQRRQFLLGELIGQTLERTMLALQPDPDRNGAVTARLEIIGTRRERLRQRLADIERNTVDYATEAQMVQYFDDVLTLGEEAAMQRLIGSVKSPAPASHDGD